MAQVTAELPDFFTPGGNADRIRFEDTTNGLVDATSLRTLTGDAIVTRLQINANQGRCFMQIVEDLGDTPADTNPSLSTAWELHIPAITLRATGLSDIGISGPNVASNDAQDTSEPYTWDPGATNVDYTGGLTQWVTDFKAAVVADPTLRATLILDDGAVAAPSFVDDTGAAIVGTVGTAITAVTVPAADGAPAPAYAASGLPGGLAFDTTTRVLSGTPTAAGSGTITVTATNSQGTADWTASFAFTAAPPPTPITPNTWFGFDGTSAAGGRTFGLAPFFVVERGPTVDAGAVTGVGALSTAEVVHVDIKPVPEPLDSRFPTIDLPAHESLLIPQYDGAAKFHALVRGIVAVLQGQVVDPLLDMSRGLNHVEGEGVLLDWLGGRMGIMRPSVPSSDFTKFGFAGTSAAGGRTFGQAPFFTVARGIESVEPIGDATYRRLLAARARRLRGGADRETIEAVLAVIWPDGDGYVDESVTPVTLRVTAADDTVWGLVSGRLFATLIPRPAGTAMTMVRS